MADWLLLHYRLPNKPSALRVYTWRKLKRLGAILLHESIWVLPDTSRTAEQVQWLVAEIQEMSGNAYSWKANTVSGEDDQSLVDQFNSQAEAIYSKLLKQLNKSKVNLQEIAQQYQQAAAQDHFHSKLGAQVREKLTSKRGEKS
jgi:DNA-binding transcriptional regulator PaaX